MTRRQIRFALTTGHGGAALLSAARDFAAALERPLRLTVKLVVAEDYERLLKKLLTGGADLAWMPPLLHARATHGGATLAVVSERDGALTYRSALLVRADAPVTALGELRDVRAAWSDPHSAAGHIVPRLHLQAAGVTFAAESFVGSPMAACAAVADGQADLCACFASERAAKDPKQVLADLSRVYAPAAWRLRVLAITDAIPPDGIVIAPGVPAADATRYGEALQKVHEHPAGETALWDLMSATRLAKAPR